MDGPDTPVHHGLGCIGRFLEVFTDLGIRDALVVEGIVLGFVVFLPGGFEQGHLALEGAGHIAVNAHGSGVVFLSQEPDGFVQVFQNEVRHGRTAVLSHLHRFQIGIQGFLHDGHSAIVAEQLVVVPGAEEISLADELVVFSGLVTIFLVAQQEVDIADAGVGAQGRCISCRQGAVDAGNGGRCRHIVAVGIGTGDVIASAHSEILGTDGRLVELVHIVLDFAGGAEGVVGREHAFRVLVQFEAGGGGCRQGDHGQYIA